jgi:uncharacterized small protein (DUF1192 family)
MIGSTHGFEISEENHISITQPTHNTINIPKSLCIMTTIRSTALFVLLLSSTASAFTVVGPRHRPHAGLSPARRFPSGTTDTSTPTVMLFGKGFAKDKANGDRAPAEEESADDTVVAAADSEEDGDTTASATEELSEEEISKKEEEEHVAALKEEIKNLESELKGKKATLTRIEEDVDKYTKTGYARRVAQMEDMRRIRLVRLSLKIHL